MKQFVEKTPVGHSYEKIRTPEDKRERTLSLSKTIKPPETSALFVKPIRKLAPLKIQKGRSYRVSAEKSITRGSNSLFLLKESHKNRNEQVKPIDSRRVRIIDEFFVSE
ncbi:hypothetical protein AVEN_49518-1 [Araneus ventricosus]|uniref:Uncharacterized protein n=1 Tax=Araneus ventricosus TaxID=182803 RepID=A0A4Y2X7W7_ARAVE|nr:hypothetical protein AVEN_221588-1 [Araneus ventricosus]GBO45024.1 hypothetical protein AVEN_49518-1 [Araneus ventricosus]